MALSPKFANVLTKKRAMFVRHFHLSDTLLSILRSQSVITEEMENLIRVNKYFLLANGELFAKLASKVN